MSSRTEDRQPDMGILIATEFMTLDGVAQAPGGPDEDRDDGFAYGGWQAPLHDEASGSTMYEQASGMDALLLGRKTYDIFAGYWPNAPEEMPFTGLLNRVPKYVVSRTLSEPLEWRNSTLLDDDLRAGIEALKERHREIHMIGSLDLGHSLLAAGLVDRLDLWVYPLVLGRGKRVFGGETMPAALQLTASVTSPNGTVHLTYELAGQPTVGDMAAG